MCRSTPATRRSAIAALVPILGGTVGGRLAGRVLIGADFQMIHGGTLARLEARYMLGSWKTAPGSSSRTTRCAPPAPRSRGGCCAASRSIRRRSTSASQVTLETGDPRWSWLNERLFLCVGQRLPTQVLMSFYVVQ